jgi:hypothetical protein
MKYFNVLILALLLTNSAEARTKHAKIGHNKGQVEKQTLTHIKKARIIEHIRNRKHQEEILVSTEDNRTNGENFSSSQKAILRTAYSTAQQEGLKNPVILPGIILHESGAGTAKKFRTSKHKAAHDQTVGLGQIKTGTAKAVIARHPEIKQHMHSKDVQHELAYNDKFNIYVAALYLKDLQDDAHSDNQLIAAYNLGHVPKKPEKMGYVKLVNRSIFNIKKDKLL